MLLSFNIYLESDWEEEGVKFSDPMEKGFQLTKPREKNNLTNLTQMMDSISERKTWNLKPGTLILCSEEEDTKSQELSFFKELMDLDALKYCSFFLKIKNIGKMKGSEGGTEGITRLMNII